MGLSVGYMGTKKHLAPLVAEVVKACPTGIAIDAFSGMCSVGEAIGSSRIVWNNDAQIFASLVAKSYFTSNSVPPTTGYVAENLYDDFFENKKSLLHRFEKKIQHEIDVLADKKLESVYDYFENGLHVGNYSDFEKERIELVVNPRKFPYRLCTITYANGYFGLLQSIEIDSIRYAIDSAIFHGKIDMDQHRWLLLALCQAIVKLAATTGHFAQYLKPNLNNLSFVIKQRQKSVWLSWLNAISTLTPLGSMEWRSGNKVFNEDSLIFLKRAIDFKERPAIIYADPPYTDDQYSRYYHIWETIVLYDYPCSAGAGRYRPDRFQTPFSKKTTVINAIDELISSSKNLGADLVLSYPNNGLLLEAGGDMISLLRKHYKNVEISHSIDYSHSTMGASKGAAKTAVQEFIYWANNR